MIGGNLFSVDTVIVQCKQCNHSRVNLECLECCHGNTISHFKAPLILFYKCIMLNIRIPMSQFLLKGQKMLNFLLAFFLKISETLKAHISETDIRQW